MNLVMMPQDAMSPLMEQLIIFHSYSLNILIFIIFIITYHLSESIINLNINKLFNESHLLEIFWTISPAVILLMIASPSIKILYLLDEINNPLITIKTNAHQWYWTYDCNDKMDQNTESFITSTDTNSFRLIETDNRLIIPMGTQIRNLVTSEDVLHSWAMPAIGAKIDAVPGRMNQISFILMNYGLIFGQCSEICGANHSFMPITLEVSNFSKFL